MGHGGSRRNAGRPPGARNKPRATAKPRLDRRRLAFAKTLDSLQMQEECYRRLFAEGQWEAAARTAKGMSPFQFQRYKPSDLAAPRSPAQLEFDLPPPPSSGSSEGPAPDDPWDRRLN